VPVGEFLWMRKEIYRLQVFDISAVFAGTNLCGFVSMGGSNWLKGINRQMSFSGGNKIINRTLM